jgi:RNase P/RNase MRP subunit p30
MARISKRDPDFDYISLRVPIELKKALLRLASDSGMKLSVYIRHLLTFAQQDKVRIVSAFKIQTNVEDE